MLAHMIFYGVIAIPVLKEEYRVAELGGPEYAKVRSNPKCRQIDALTREPVEKAVPAIIGFFSDPEQDVRAHAAATLTTYTTHYRVDAEPYLKEAIASRDKNTVDGALWVIGACGYSGFKQEVRDLAWSVDDLRIPLSAVLTLGSLGDEEGLRRIAHGHPNETVRRDAERCLAGPLFSKPPDSSPPAK
jgi:HEAT repeat protein